ncbi:hypothetical protein [Aestuariivirga sp.]|uniref:hypothetical protein n=1 Tax=Aestuariivirga sp. TaxID=2650926 RepID=UPI0039E21CE3
MPLKPALLKNAPIRWNPRQLAEMPLNWQKKPMCFHMTASGSILPLWSRTAYDEVMLHCARVGFKP